MSFAFVILCAVLVTVLVVCLSSTIDAVEFACVLFTLLHSKAYAAAFGCVVCPVFIASLPATFWLRVVNGVFVSLEGWSPFFAHSPVGSPVINTELSSNEPNSNAMPTDEPGIFQEPHSLKIKYEVRPPADSGQADASTLIHQSQKKPEPLVKPVILRKRRPFKLSNKSRRRSLTPAPVAPVSESTLENIRRFWGQVPASRTTEATFTLRDEDQAAKTKTVDKEVVEAFPSPEVSSTTPVEKTKGMTPTMSDVLPATPEMTPHKRRLPGAFSVSSEGSSSDELQTPSASGSEAAGSEVGEDIEDYDEECGGDGELEGDGDKESEGEEEQHEEIDNRVGSEEGSEEVGDEVGEGRNKDEKSEAEVEGGEEVEDADGAEAGSGAEDEGPIEVEKELDENQEQHSTTLLNIGDSAYIPVDVPALINAPTLVIGASHAVEGAQIVEQGVVETPVVRVEVPIINDQATIDDTGVVQSVEEGEATNNGHDKAGDDNQVLDPQMNHSTQVSGDPEEQPSSVDLIGNPTLDPAGPAIVADAPPVAEGAQTVRQGQVHTGAEETIANEPTTVANDKSVTSGELALKTPYMDSLRPTNEEPGAVSAGVSEDNEQLLVGNPTGRVHGQTAIEEFQTRSSNKANSQTLGDESKLETGLPGSSSTPTTMEPEGQDLMSNPTGAFQPSNHAVDSRRIPVDSIGYEAGFAAGFQAGMGQIVQQLGTPLALGQNSGYGGSTESHIWNETQSTTALAQAQVLAHGEVADVSVVGSQVEGPVGMYVQGQQPEMVAEQAMGPGVSPPSSSLAPAAASPQAGMPMGLPILVPGPTADAPIHLPVMEPSPNAAGIPVPSPTPTRSSLPVRRSRASAFRGQKRRPYPAVRRPLPQKPRKESLEPELVNTSHITYYAYKAWRLVGLRKALRACFPQWEETGFLPQYHVPGVPTMWIPAVAYDVEAPTIQEPDVTPGAETTAVAEPTQNIEHPTFPEETWRVGQPPVTWPRRSSRTSVFHESELKGPLHQGQRPHLLRRRKKCRAPDPTPNTSHITYYGYKIWRLVARKKVCRACFPQWEATGFVPQYLVPDVPTLWSPPPADAIAQDIDALALGMQQAAIAEPANAQELDVAPTVDVPAQGEASEPTATQPTSQAVDELADMFAGVMQNVQNAANGEAAEPGQVGAASAEGQVVEEAEAVVADSDEEDAAEVEAELQIELGEEDMVAAEAYLNGLGLFGSGGL